MFTYLDADIKQRLIKENKLNRINREGEKIAHDAPSVADGELNLLGPIPLPITVKEKTIHVAWYACVRRSQLKETDRIAEIFRDKQDKYLFAEFAPYISVNSVLVIGDPKPDDNPFVRIHSNCLTGDVFGSQRCECGPQLEQAIITMNDTHNGGYLIYMAGHEGRGIGLWAKAATYLLQDAGENTYQANESLGLPRDSRNFDDAATLIHYFIGNQTFQLLTNNPKKTNDLKQNGLNRFTTVEHVHGVNDNNKHYLKAKAQMGHTIGPLSDS